MTLDKIDLCEARAAFDAHPEVPAWTPGRREAIWNVALLNIDAQWVDPGSPIASMRAAALAAREWHRALAEKAKECEQ